MHLERILQSQGFGSRKQCRALVRDGRVRVDGVAQDDPFTELEPLGRVLGVDDADWPYCTQIYLMLNKPAGVECSRSPRDHTGVFSLLPPQFSMRGVQPVGRLDEDTTGLLLLSDDGAFIHHLTSPRRKVAKVYRVTTRHAVDEAQVQALLGGVVLHDAPEAVRALACVALDTHTLQMSVAEGRYHQVKRMVAASGNRVEALQRIQVGEVVLPEDLAPGAWRYLHAAEVAALQG